MPTYHRTKDGAQVTEQEALDERGILRDGHRMLTKFMLRDGQSVFDAKADEIKCRQIDAYNRNIGDRWRDPPPLIETKDVDVRAATLSAMKTPYERYDARIADAWRS